MYPKTARTQGVTRTTLDQILAATRARLPELWPRRAELERRAAAKPPPASWRLAFARRDVALVAEVKRRSPSAGVIQADLDPRAHAVAYATGGAAAISVLTDGPFFGGSLADLESVAGAVPIPVLRKDFILDELQLVEARAAGAGAVLLIVRALDSVRLRALARAAHGLGLGTLVEVHTEAELGTALAAEPTTIGVNSRDLATFKVDPVAALRLIAHVPRETPAIAESGILNRDDVLRAAGAGADAVLVGTVLSQAADPSVLVRTLVGVERRGRG
jgi:indole-3-glycerol phosphate synthase